MDDDDEVCLCFHVTQRKIKSFIRIHQPRVASQISQCGGAGTGCGWCRPFLERLLHAAQGTEQPPSTAAPLSLRGTSASDGAGGENPIAYRVARERYLAQRRSSLPSPDTSDSPSGEPGSS